MKKKGANPDSNEFLKSTEKHHRKTLTSGLLHEEEPMKVRVN
jgi:plasmid stability protein